MQALILPIKDMLLTASYKNKVYANYFGFAHFGIDCGSRSGNTALYGLGDGEVIAAGLDGTNGEKSGLGYVLVVRYNACRVHYMSQKQEETRDLICTYFHMRETPRVKAGDKVTKTTLLGHYGNTGANTTGPHLHIQFDTDINFPLHCYGVSGRGSSIIKRGTQDTTLDPLDILHIGDGQTLEGRGDAAWWDGETFDLPKASDAVDWKEKYENLVKDIKMLVE